MSDIVNELDSKFVRGAASQVTAIRCPVCNGRLTVTFSEIRGRKSLAIRCPNSCYRSNIDGLESAPPWVKELGDKFETT
jgi:hypothetical protein